MKKILCEDIRQIHDTAMAIIDFCKSEKIWVFKGRMGAGKTTLIRAISDLVGITDTVTSPTFSIVNEYQNNKGESIYHFDFYRIENASEVLDIGIEEYFYSGAYCWIEWAERIPEYIPENFMLIQIEVDEEGRREITLNQVINGTQNG